MGSSVPGAPSGGSWNHPRLDYWATPDWIITLRATLSLHPLWHFQCTSREGNNMVHNLAWWGFQNVAQAEYMAEDLPSNIVNCDDSELCMWVYIMSSRKKKSLIYSVGNIYIFLYFFLIPIDRSRVVSNFLFSFFLWYFYLPFLRLQKKKKGVCGVVNCHVVTLPWKLRYRFLLTKATPSAQKK